MRVLNLVSRVQGRPKAYGVFRLCCWGRYLGLREARIEDNEQLHDLYCSPNAIWMVKLKKNKMGGACGTYGGRGEAHTGFWWGNLRERDRLEDLCVDEKNNVEWIFSEIRLMVHSGFSRLRISVRWRTVVKAPMNIQGPITYAQFIDYLLLFSVGLPVANAPDVLQPCGLLYYPWCSNSHHQSSPQEILAVRGGA